jgi:Protein of unknown function (DUF3892)
MSIRITCITKAGGDHENPYVAISRFGWVNLLNPAEKKFSTSDQMYEYVKNGNEAWVYDKSGNIRSKLMALTSLRGTKYVKTEADFTINDNLLKLDEC